jgi:phage terminase large subunit-like protein
MIVTVPKYDGKAKAWPTLGPYVCQWIEDNLVHGPGDMLGERITLDDEKRMLIYAWYEVFPNSHARAGRRRFKRVAISLRKGLAKTELAAFIAAAELSSFGPVRTVGWDRKGYPIGGPIVDPYLALVSYTEEQTEEQAYGALRVILTESPIAKDFDIGLERVMRKDGHGKAEALATSPNAADGARTTWQLFDETHRLSQPRLKKAHETMLANVAKRRTADAWTMETTTAFAPGEKSIAESTMEMAEAIIAGKAKDDAFFFFHRAASDGHDLTTAKGARAAVVEASGPDGLKYGDLDEIVRQILHPPNGDQSYSERVWTNRLVRSADKAFDSVRWKHLAKPGYVIPKGAAVTLGFDGARHRDATALIATEIITGVQVLLGLWEQPFGEAGKEWAVPEDEVSAKVAEAFKTFKVWRLYADPPYWETTVNKWAGEFTEDRVISWATNQESRMGPAVRAYSNAMRDGDVSHDGDERFARHIGATYRRTVNVRNDKGEYEPFWVLQKERKDSPNKIDAAVAGVLSWRARLDALTAGMATAGKGMNARASRGEEVFRSW